MPRQTCHRGIISSIASYSGPRGRRTLRGRRLRFEPLEPRQLLTITVNTLVDENNGIGVDGISLREAIAAATPGETIDFAVTGTINLTSTGSGHLTIDKNLTIQGPGAGLLTIKAFDPDADGANDSDGHRVFFINDGQSGRIDVTLSGLTIAGGDPEFDVDPPENTAGGGIRNRENLTIIGCVITDNFSPNGGGIANELANLTVIDSAISGNRTDDGGAIFTQAGMVTALRTTMENNFSRNSGGAILSRNGNVTITDSTISGNEVGNPEVELSGVGGGLASYFGSMAITGSTISGNSAGYHGGGVFNYVGALTITNSTISGNVSDEDGGGFYNHYLTNETVTIAHSTITGNTTLNGSGGGLANAEGADDPDLDHTIVAGNFRGASTRDDLSGSFIASFTLIGDRRSASISNQGGNLIGTTSSPIDAMLGPLANNGGPTLTHTLLIGSPAIDSGDPAAVAGAGGVPEFDQRGTPFGRIVDGDAAGGARIDMGAIEVLGELPEPLVLVVDISLDESDGNVAAGDLSLREALELANANAGALDSISFHSSLIGSTITLTLGQLAITDPVHLMGPGAELLTVDASGNDPTPLVNNGDGSRVFVISNNSAAPIEVEISGLTLTGGDVTGAGGAVQNAENLTLMEVTIQGNHATATGGGIDQASGNLAITDSTLSGNSAGDDGGGIHNASGNVSIVGSTIRGNSALGNGEGGGIYSNTLHTIVIAHSTIAENSVGATGRGGGIRTNTTAQLDHTIVAGNFRGAERDDTSGSFRARYSLIGDRRNAGVNDQGGSLIGTTASPINAMLGPLGDNGGPTLTHAPLSGSPAIDSGDPAAIAGTGGVPSFDQRGMPFSRVEDADGAGQARIDMGALEVPAPPPMPLSLVVDILIDENDGNFAAGDLSLREAIFRANANAGLLDTISFHASLGGGTIALALGELVISDAVVITGPGAGLLTVDASSSDPTPTTDNGDGSRIFHIDDATGTAIDVQIGGLTLTGGDSMIEGGAILNDENLTLTGVTVTGNHTVLHGGGIANGSATLMVAASTFTGNSANSGGGMSTVGGEVTVSQSSIDANTAGTGGGIWKQGGPLTVIDSTLSGNSATSAGGGAIANLIGNVTVENSILDRNSAAGDGGAVLMGGDTLRVTTSTLSGNSAQSGGGISSGSDAMITGATLSGNTTSQFGGGIHHHGELLTVRHSTITANTAPAGQGSGIASQDNPLTSTAVYSSIVAGNTASDVDFVGASNSFLSNGHNLIGTGNAVGAFAQPGDQSGVTNPMLGPLGDNGGPTMTHALLIGSPAIDAGDPAAVAGVGDVPLFDQRGPGFDRVLDGDQIPGARIDIGAVEAPVPPGPELPGDYNLDGIVDAVDYTVWRNTLGANVASFSGADGNGDGIVNQADHAVWKANFGNELSIPATAASASVEAVLSEAQVALQASSDSTATNHTAERTALTVVPPWTPSTSTIRRPSPSQAPRSSAADFNSSDQRLLAIESLYASEGEKEFSDAVELFDAEADDVDESAHDELLDETRQAIFAAWSALS